MNWFQRLLAKKCPRCNGTGVMTWIEWKWNENKEMPCTACKGTGIKN